MTDRVESVRSIMSQGISVIRIPSAGGPQETVCLPLDLLNGFLFGIDENRVKDPAARERLIVYKRHGFRALFEYFNPSAAGVEPPRAAPET
ncbi:hypothetical protein CDV50_18830, partial [Haematobacter massiliensis]|uniref:phage antirepressor N-terminal domain-containing protein n=1 Tax=Haematobacter massiliensis TaxID=195105 RepID=UPI000B75C916